MEHETLTLGIWNKKNKKSVIEQETRLLKQERYDKEQETYQLKQEQYNMEQKHGTQNINIQYGTLRIGE